MKNQIVLIALSFLLALGACKKEEETHTCPEIGVPYQSLRAYGDTTNMVRVVIYPRPTIKDTEDSNFDGVEGPECIGIFLVVSSLVNSDSNILFYKITNELPSWVMDNSNNGNTEFLVNLKYFGIGIECYVNAHLVDPAPGRVVEKNDVELVEVTHIEPYL